MDAIPMILCWSSSFLHCSARLSRAVSVPDFSLYPNTLVKKYFQNKGGYLERSKVPNTFDKNGKIVIGL